MTGKDARAMRIKSIAIRISIAWLTIFSPLAALISECASAQTYPSKPITIVVPAAPGGVLDILARQLGQRFTASWGQNVIVEYRAGANSQIAANYVAKSPADGYTLFVSPEPTFTVNPFLYPKSSYDAANDFTPISGLVFANELLVANAAVPARDLKTLFELAKASPEKFNYGTFGLGSTAHLHMAQLASLAGARLTAIHYKGALPALNDIIAGHVAMMFTDVRLAIAQEQAGKIRIIAAGSGTRLPQLPDVPTVAESGYPGYIARTWFGLFAPAGLPREIGVKINDEVQRAFADPSFQSDFLSLYMFDPVNSSLERFDAFIKSEREKTGEILRSEKIVLN
jgi:tripartite-type tricarboxylate transporter receptor subunit TctC